MNGQSLRGQSLCGRLTVKIDEAPEYLNIRGEEMIRTGEGQIGDGHSF